MIIMSLSTISAQENNAPLTIGLFADCQYAEAPTLGSREYKNAKSKLKEFVKDMNQILPDAVINLGDLVDRNEDDFFNIIMTVSSLKMALYSVAGNHDFSAFKNSPQETYSALMMPAPYYTEKMGQWKFIFLDGNQKSSFGWKKGTKEYKDSLKYKKEVAPASAPWNGGVGQKQLEWLDEELSQAESANEKVILFCHYPILPKNALNLWDDTAVLKLIKAHPSVKAWISGHNHKGNFAKQDGKLFLTIKGMVEKGKNSYAILKLYPDKLILQGFGEQESFELDF